MALGPRTEQMLAVVLSRPNPITAAVMRKERIFMDLIKCRAQGSDASLMSWP